MGVSVNVSLGLFNLIPIPPLDGSQILKVLIGMKEETFLAFSQMGTILLIILINLRIFNFYFRLAHYLVLDNLWRFCEMLFY
jgi:Zn-dependent protease